jgi:deoxyadenosine/deoxycytidine kinase
LWQLFCLLGVTQCVRFARDNPKLARFVFTTQIRRPLPITTRVQVLRWFVQLAGRYRLLTRTSGELDVLVLDDGFLHRAVHLHADHVSEPDLACLAAYIDLVPRPDLVIFTTARADTCERRVRARGVWRHSRHLSRAELSRYMANAERVATQAAHLASERGWQVIEIENEQRTLDDARHDLAGALELLTLDQLAMRDCLSGARA